MTQGSDSQEITNHGSRMPKFGRGRDNINDRASQVVIQRNPCSLKIYKSTFKIATWNVRSMYESGKLRNIEQEMVRLEIDMLGISDTRWIDSGELDTGNGRVYYSGSSDTQHRYGVAIILSKNVVKSVTGFVPISERDLMLQLMTSHGKLNLIQTYAPTADKEEAEIEKFYNAIQKTLQLTSSRDITVVMGDFNAKIGEGRCDSTVGPYGLGVRNERGDRLIEFCQENNLVVANTFFKLPKRRLYTWKSPADTDNNIVRNQIDYILIKHRYRNAMKSVKAYPGADVYSDHNPLIARFQLQLKKIQTCHKMDKLNLEKLKSEEIKEDLEQQINANLERNTSKSQQNEENAEKQWQFFKKSIIEPSKKVLTTNKCKKEDWMTDEILELMSERRKCKTSNNTRYKQLQNQIRRKIREAKETYFSERCDEIEELQNKYDNFNLHKKVKELAGVVKRRSSNILLDREGNVMVETEQKLRRWKEYIEELFHDQRQENTSADYQGGYGGPEITKSEVEHALKSMKNKKSVGPDGIPSELLKLINDKNIDILMELFNTIYNTGIIPQEMLTSTFICLPKKVIAKECSDYRTISLMSHTLKVLLKIIHTRIHSKLELDISDTQFGFRNGVGTREALFSFNVLVQRCLDVNQDLYICFIDYNKAFDKVKHDQLVDLLINRNLDEQDVRLISNLYYNQRATVRIGQEKSEEMEIKRGVRQGCILSPLLFNAYSEQIMLEALEDETAGIKVNGVLINNIRYADDTVIITDSLGDLERVMSKIKGCGENYGLSLNIKKTKFMKISKNNNTNETLMVGGQQIERVKRYTYLGTLITENNDYTAEIKTRIEKARTNFIKMKKVLCSKDLTLALKLRLTKCYVHSVLYYGVESWTLNADAMRRLNSFEMWTYRRILRISWEDRITNIEVLRRIGKEREVELTVKGRKLQYLGHIMRGEKYSILRLIIQGKIEGRRSVGRRRISWLKNLREWFGCSSKQLFRATASKVKIAMMIANLRRGDST